jgi:hypothetical protein
LEVLRAQLLIISTLSLMELEEQWEDKGKCLTIGAAKK